MLVHVKRSVVPFEAVRLCVCKGDNSGRQPPLHNYSSSFNPGPWRLERGSFDVLVSPNARAEPSDELSLSFEDRRYVATPVCAM
jgi:hypothetical protein